MSDFKTVPLSQSPLELAALYENGLGEKWRNQTNRGGAETCEHQREPNTVESSIASDPHARCR